MGSKIKEQPGIFVPGLETELCVVPDYSLFISQQPMCFVFKVFSVNSQEAVVTAYPTGKRNIPASVELRL